MLSSSAKLNKQKSKKRGNQRQQEIVHHHPQEDDSDSSVEDDNAVAASSMASRDRTGKRDLSQNKQQQIQVELMAAFRRSMHIKVADKHDPHLPNAIASFDEIKIPSWWNRDRGHDERNDTNADALSSFQAIKHAVLHNIEKGRWKEPTPIQMQSIPTLLERRDLLACAPTGSGKSGAFILPALILSHAANCLYYNSTPSNNAPAASSSKKQKKKLQKQQVDSDSLDPSKSQSSTNRQGEIRSLLLAPSRELAAQLHREVDRLGMGKPGGISSLLLMKANASHVIAGTAGGKSGLDVLVTTPLRLVDALHKGLRLDAVRIVVLDEADRLLDAADGKQQRDDKKKQKKKEIKEEKRQSSNPSSDGSSTSKDSEDEEEEEEEDDEDDDNVQPQSSGSSQTQTFLAQMDSILSAVPTSAVRALFSATVTQTVKSLSHSILRNPVDVTIASPGSAGGANTDIEQELMFVGREEGKLLAMRQLKLRGQLKPPVIVFVQSQERAQALFGELLYDGLHVDVIHAGRSRTARDNAVARFRKGETWVLICTDLVARGVDFRAVNMVINYDLPTSGITYVHRIGRCGRAGRKGKAITLFTEADFDNLRTIANVMKQSGCKVEDWMLQLKKSIPKKKSSSAPRRSNIDTTPTYDKKKRFHKRQMIQESKRKKQRTGSYSKDQRESSDKR
ncbi:DNA/RNA helicase, superfamily II, SNF2 family protein [Nitzschia inconspicua]|uniref:RNA helicase n=1 Tax=Nitzschia inconspicua TaxID=303405 RepID=A0A9K3Q4S9_9STRA|nr:DNA/RNA helicase, superfamily II, SNF2 family protein [Nitzschia inconspicua]